MPKPERSVGVPPAILDQPTRPQSPPPTKLTLVSEFGTFIADGHHYYAGGLFTGHVCPIAVLPGGYAVIRHGSHVRLCHAIADVHSIRFHREPQRHAA